MRARLVLAGLAAALAPATHAVAEHCNDVVVLTQHLVRDPDGEPVTIPFVDARVGTPATDTRAPGCFVAPDDESLDTSLIVPGSNSATVRYAVAPPTSGWFSFAGVQTSLTFVEIAGPGGTVYESMPIFYNTAASVNGGFATATVCVGHSCSTTTYHTLSQVIPE